MSTTRKINELVTGLSINLAYKAMRDSFKHNNFLALPTDISHGIADYLEIKELAKLKSVNKTAFDKLNNYDFSDRFVQYTDKVNPRFSNQTISNYIDDYNKTFTQAEQKTNISTLVDQITVLDNEIKETPLDYTNDNFKPICNRGWIGGVGGFTLGTIIGKIISAGFGLTSCATVTTILSSGGGCCIAGICVCAKCAKRKHETTITQNEKLKTTVSQTRQTIFEQISMTSNRNTAQPPEVKHTTVSNDSTNLRSRLLDHDQINSHLDSRLSIFSQGSEENKQDTNDEPVIEFTLKTSFI